MAGNASHMVCTQYSGCCHHGGCVVTGTQKSFPKLWGGSDRLPIPKGGVLEHGEIMLLCFTSRCHNVEAQGAIPHLPTNISIP